jgi:hypothetical protein
MNEIAELVRQAYDQEMLKHNHMSWLSGGVSDTCATCQLLIKTNVIQVEAGPDA